MGFVITFIIIFIVLGILGLVFNCFSKLYDILKEALSNIFEFLGTLLGLILKIMADTFKNRPIDTGILRFRWLVSVCLIFSAGLWIFGLGPDWLWKPVTVSVLFIFIVMLYIRHLLISKIESAFRNSLARIHDKKFKLN
jgi:hypothetical protein